MAFRAPSHTHDWETYSISGIVKRSCHCGDVQLDLSDEGLELTGFASSMLNRRSTYLLDAATTLELDRGYTIG
jgi:hypothetical protein